MIPIKEFRNSLILDLVSKVFWKLIISPFSATVAKILMKITIRTGSVKGPGNVTNDHRTLVGGWSGRMKVGSETSVCVFTVIFNRNGLMVHSQK